VGEKVFVCVSRNAVAQPAPSLPFALPHTGALPGLRGPGKPIAVADM
jgi:hypothetical protein